MIRECFVSVTYWRSESVLHLMPGAAWQVYREDVASAGVHLTPVRAAPTVLWSDRLAYGSP
jgi:hypothetical protein